MPRTAVRSEGPMATGCHKRQDPKAVAFGLFVGVILLVLTLPMPGRAREIAKGLGLGNQSALRDSEISSGLKEALQIGTENAVKLTGRPDGYFGNQAIRILFPKNLRLIEKGLRAVGYGPQVDAFVLSMNRSAEAAAPAAKKIFLNAIVSMTFDDARRILSGGDTAATDYFKSKTTEQLTTVFRPVVEKTMSKNAVAQQYDYLMGQAQTVPFMKSQNLNITDYVVSQAIDGLFYMLGQEERKIRKDPAAQTTALLKQVFAK
jgi:hypothetical protein